MIGGFKCLLSFAIIFALLSGCFLHEYKEKNNSPIEISPGIVFHTIVDLPGILPESSGLEIVDSLHFYSINDSKGKAALYVFDTLGELTRTIKIKDAENVDWEDLAQDEHGNIYIADSGNNDNERENLKFYQIPAETLSNDNVIAESIYFRYENQIKFPPHDSTAFFDSEASFVFNDSIYLLIKDRSKPYAGKTFLYQIPAKPGDYKAVLKGEFRTFKTKKEGSITSADISPDGTKMAMLSQKNVWIFYDFEGSDFFGGKVQFIPLPTEFQLEGIAFANECLIYLTNEKSKGFFSALHQLKICD